MADPVSSYTVSWTRHAACRAAVESASTLAPHLFYHDHRTPRTYIGYFGRGLRPYVGRGHGEKLFVPANQRDASHLPTTGPWRNRMNEFIGALMLVSQLLTGKIESKHWINIGEVPDLRAWVPSEVYDYNPEAILRNQVPAGEPPIWWFDVRVGDNFHRVRISQGVYNSFMPGDSISWDPGM